MPFFRYTAIDASGKPVEGTVEARGVHDAAKSLTDRGFQVRQVVPSTVAAAPFLASGTGVTQAGSLSYRGVRTRVAGDKDRFVLFAQVASMLRAGVNPHQAFETLSKRTRQPGLEMACRDVANGAREGAPVSAVLARYPYLFPPHVVGTVRAGEVGGFLPEACERISEQAESSHKFGRAMWMMGAVALHGLLVIPGAVLATRAVSLAWDKIDASGGAGGAAGGLQMMKASMLELLYWPIGPLTLAGYFLAWLGWLGWRSMPLRGLRHKLGLRWVAFGPRAKHEGLAQFSWALARISTSGIPPDSAWGLALDCVPNLALRERLALAGARLRESRPLSEAFHDDPLFPEEYAPIMATAEMTGDIPGTLARLAEADRSEFETASGKAKWRAGCWSYLGCFVCSAFVFGLFIWMWLYELPKKILDGMGG